MRLVPTALLTRTGEVEAEESAEASDVIDLLAEALEAIATATTDPRARELAENALVEFQGR